MFSDAPETLEVVAALDAGAPYERTDYRGDGWRDFDADCLSTRHEVLVVESSVDAVLSADGCLIESGVWIDPWSDDRMTTAEEATIDHMIPLSGVRRAAVERPWPAGWGRSLFCLTVRRVPAQ